MSDIDLNQLRRLDGGLLLVFRELLRTRRASVTAERLGLSQSAISHALNRLRDLFGDQLFVRRPHGFEPTRRAQELGPRIEALIALAGETLTRTPGFDPAKSRRAFQIGAPEFVIALIGAALINQFRDQAPAARFGVGHVAEADAYRALRSGQIDLALGRFGAARPGYVTELLYEDRFCVVARKGNPKVAGGIDHAAWRSIGHVLAWSPSETATDPPAAQDMAVLAFVPGWLTVLLLVAETDGLATCPRRLAERHADRLGLQVIDPPFEPDVISVSAVRRAGLEDAGVDWLLARIRQAIA
ncbi:MAG: LysR family transcriptional regulator [Phenylobacterium sp.]